MRFYVTFAKPMIACIKCGTEAEAGLMSIGQWCHSTANVEAIVNSKWPDIPVGWSSNGWSGGRRDLRCTACTAGVPKP